MASRALKFFVDEFTPGTMHFIKHEGDAGKILGNIIYRKMTEEKEKHKFIFYAGNKHENEKKVWKYLF